MEIWHPARLCSLQRMTPHLWPEEVGITSHPFCSAYFKAFSISPRGCRRRVMLTFSNILLLSVNTLTAVLRARFRFGLWRQRS